MSNAFNWMSDFGVKLVEIGQELFKLLSYELDIPFIGDYTVLEVGFTALPIVLIPILLYKAIMG